jgi:uncharacterized protein YbbK (DUF523 family)
MLRIGISSCLLGNTVRYDGGHKHDRVLTDLLGPLVEWVPVCPEVEVGMGVPREPIRLVRRGNVVRLLGEQSSADHTEAMYAWARFRLEQLERLELCGFVLKKDSPSCGPAGVRVYAAEAEPMIDGRGLFAAELLARFTGMPVEEDEALHDPSRRSKFIESAIAYRRARYAAT